MSYIKLANYNNNNDNSTTIYTMKKLEHNLFEIMKILLDPKISTVIEFYEIEDANIKNDWEMLLCLSNNNKKIFDDTTNILVGNIETSIISYIEMILSGIVSNKILFALSHLSLYPEKYINFELSGVFYNTLFDIDINNDEKYSKFVKNSYDTHIFTWSLKKIADCKTPKLQFFIGNLKDNESLLYVTSNRFFFNNTFERSLGDRIIKSIIDYFLFRFHIEKERFSIIDSREKYDECMRWIEKRMNNFFDLIKEKQIKKHNRISNIIN